MRKERKPSQSRALVGELLDLAEKSAKPAERYVLFETAAELGHGAVGIADRNSVAGIVRAHVAAKRVGSKLVIGARLVLACDDPIIGPQHVPADLVDEPGTASRTAAGSWTGGTLFPLSSKKVARSINAASGRRPVVMLANLSGFDGSLISTTLNPAIAALAGLVP